MARAHLRDVVQTVDGGVQVSKNVHVFLDGTGVDSASPTGTAVTMYTTATGGTTTTNPLVTNAGGEFECWVDLPGPYDIVVVDGAAHVKETIDAQYRKTANERVLYVDADADAGNNTLPSQYRGTKEYPYAGGDGLILAFSDIAGTANNASVPVEVRVYGSSGVDTSPSVITLTQRLDLGIGAWLRGWGGGDADRNRAAVLITGSISGELVRINGRYVKITDVAIKNSHAAGVGVAINTTNPGGGFQNPYMEGVHIYECGSHGMILQTFNTDLAMFQRCQFLWNGRSTSAYGVLVRDSDGTPDSSPNAVMFINCEAAHNSEAGVGLIQGESNPSSGDVVYFINHKGHGSRPRFDIRGWHNIVIDGYYLETNGQSKLDTDCPIIKVRDGTGGATADFYTYGLTIRGRGRIHGANRQAAAATTLNGGITDSQTTITVVSNVGFPGIDNGVTEPNTIVCESEKMRIVRGDASGLVWTVIRGVDGTVAASHLTATAVTKTAWTAGVGIVLDIDECTSFDVSGMEVMGADSTSDNPHMVFGATATRGYVRQAFHTAGEQRGTQITTFANLFGINATAQVNVEWWDGTNVRSVGNKPGEIQATATWNPALLAAVGDVTTTTVTATGARAGDTVEVSHDAIGASKVIMYAWVSSDNTVTVLLQNQEGVNLNLASGALTVRVRRPQ